MIQIHKSSGDHTCEITIEFNHAKLLVTNGRQDRLSQVQDTPCFNEEVSVVFYKMKRGVEYYQHVLDNVMLDNNVCNSRIMWVAQKTDQIDLNAPLVYQKEHYELPDIDVDFGVEDREWVLKYLRHKYGQENVAQIITFQRMQGRSALKDVFRVKNVPGGFEYVNQISQFIPQEAEIADDIEDMHQAGYEDYGIIHWAIDNSNAIQEFYQNAKLKEVFDQAMRCEGSKRACGRHPSGVVVTPRASEEYFPMAYDTRAKEQIIGVDMNDVAKLGGVKLDVLGTAILDKMQLCCDLVNNQKANNVNS